MYKKAGVCIFIHRNLTSKDVKEDKFCIEKVIDVCTIMLQLTYLNICILAIYRTSTDNFKLFLSETDTLLKSLDETNMNFTVCGDMNIDYLIDCFNKKQLDTMLLSYNLVCTVQLPTRIQNNSDTAIDSIFIDLTKFCNYTAQPFYNDLPDCDVQIIIIKYMLQYQCKITYKIRKFNKDSTTDFIGKTDLVTMMWMPYFFS